MEASHSKKFQTKHDRKPRYTERSPHVPKSRETALARILLGGWLNPQDVVALLVLFLAPEASDYVTEQILTLAHCYIKTSRFS
jgi:hypothetical protein